MSRKAIRAPGLALLALGVALLAPGALAGTTGKLSGRVASEKNEPLAGVNIRIEGQRLGSDRLGGLAPADSVLGDMRCPNAG